MSILRADTIKQNPLKDRKQRKSLIKILGKFLLKKYPSTILTE
jgi:hypothetical protein